MKKKYEIVFVVLVYANTVDVVEFLDSLKVLNCTYKVIIINSFYNEETCLKIKKISVENNCDFLNVENRGYGAGNNRGIEFAKANYLFDFLIVSNPDIIIKQLDYNYLCEFTDAVIGPKIIASSGKNQNPFYIDKKIFAKQECVFLKKRNKIGYYSIIAINKLKKMLFFAYMNLMKKTEEVVYAIHGSFIIFSNKALDRIGMVFDENIFLFCEEMVLAEIMKRKKITAIYTSNIVVNHKEDGSMDFLRGSMYEEEVKSNEYVYNNYFAK